MCVSTFGWGPRQRQHTAPSKRLSLRAFRATPQTRTKRTRNRPLARPRVTFRAPLLRIPQLRLTLTGNRLAR
jgi:hypothetical protein